ncbi:hypothetical protein CLAFUW4_03015 [Fulvia fulva]|nr:hypothetical protein CLAFUR4_03008 [Fulvia fulva]KAK4632669.1 hypothetical protein CLAFUR0_03011 [Fulvia fulva]WPV10459.1 hypothetical protein CLAFUW4_03015 [Fulvia fulva]WPV26321.1 hypothetical protein CLAFUW7_03012 [Fulvia fulva]
MSRLYKRLSIELEIEESGDINAPFPIEDLGDLEVDLGFVGVSSPFS